MYQVGNVEKKKAIIDHVNNNEHVLIYGKEGTGKTIFIREIDLKNYEIRYFDRYENVDFESASFSSLFSISNVFMRKRLIVLDNFDTLEIKHQKIIHEHIKKSKFPVVIVCNKIDKIIESIKNVIYMIEFDMLSFEEFKMLLKEWKENNIIKIDKDPERLYKKFDGNIRRLMNNYTNYEDQDPVADNEEISARKLARFVFYENDMNEITSLLLQNKYRLKTVMEYISASLFSFYASMTKISIATELLSYINTIIFESSNFEYIAGLLLTLPAKDYNGRMSFIKINKKFETEEVEEE